MLLKFSLCQEEKRQPNKPCTRGNVFWNDNTRQAHRKFVAMSETDAVSCIILALSALICILGVAGNVFGAIILRNMEKLKFGGVRLLRYLTYADISVLLFYLMKRTLRTIHVYVYAISGKEYIDLFLLHLQRTIHTFEVYLTVIIAFQRCVALGFPLKVTTLLTDRRINKILIGAGVLSVMLPIPACVMIYPRLHTSSQNLSTEDVELDVERVYRHYILATFYIYIPLVVLVMCNIALVYFRARMTTEIRKSRTRGPGQLTAVVFTITAMSVATHTCTLIYIKLCSTDKDAVSQSTNCLPKLITNLVLFVNCSTNVIFYCCFGRAFRRHLQQSFCKRLAQEIKRKSETEVTTVEQSNK